MLAGGDNCFTRRRWEWVRVTCSLCFLAVLGKGEAWYPKAILLTIFMADSKGRKLPFHGRARCRNVARAQAPEPLLPEAGQCAMDGDSGRRPLIERPPLRSLGPVLALAESSAPRTDWLLRGQLVVLGKGGVRHSRASGGSRPLCLRGQWFAASHRVLCARWCWGAALAWRHCSWLLLPKCSLEHRGQVCPIRGRVTRFTKCWCSGHSLQLCRDRPARVRRGRKRRCAIQDMLGQLDMLCTSQRGSSLTGRVALGSREGMQASCTGRTWVARVNLACRS